MMGITQEMKTITAWFMKKRNALKQGEVWEKLRRVYAQCQELVVYYQEVCGKNEEQETLAREVSEIYIQCLLGKIAELDKCT